MTRTAPRVRLTTRGTGLAVAGLALAAVGHVAALDALLTLGLMLLVPVVATTLGLVVSRPDRRLVVRRTLRPLPVHAGGQVTVTTCVSPARLTPWTSDTLHGLGLSEEVPEELRSGGPLRALVRARYEDVRLEYAVRPGRRGRWPLGPLRVTRVGALGLVRATSTLGGTAEVTVWPALLPLDGVTRLAQQGLAPSRSGASDPSDEDASLRSYQPGDDLRRVHWKSAARHRELLVRVDEGASLTPATVVVDLPAVGTRGAEDTHVERVVAVGASLALHLLATGHAVRLVATGDSGSSSAGVGARHVSYDETARTQLLGSTVDLTASEPGPARDDARAALLADVVAGRRGAEMLVAVLAADTHDLVTELAPYGADTTSSATRVAVVVGSPQRPAPVAHHLREHGWRVVVLEDDDLAEAWRRLAGAAT